MAFFNLQKTILFCLLSTIASLSSTNIVLAGSDNSSALYRAYVAKDWPTVERLAKEEIATGKNRRVAQSLLGYTAFEKGDFADAAKIFDELQHPFWRKTRANQFMAKLAQERMTQPNGNLLEQATRVYATLGFISKCKPNDNCLGNDSATSEISKNIEPLLNLLSDVKAIKGKPPFSVWIDSLRSQLRGVRTESAAVADAFLLAHSEPKAESSAPLREYLRKYPKNDAIQAIYVSYVIELDKSGNKLDAEAEKILATWARSDKTDLTPGLLKFALRQSTTYCVGSRCHPSDTPTTPTCTGLSEKDLGEFNSMNFEKGHFRQLDKNTARLTYDEIMKVSKEPALAIGFAVIGMRAASTLNSDLRLHAIKLARVLGASVCEVLTEQGTSKAILLGEKGLMMADQLLRSSDTVANFRVAMPVRGILERALEPVYEKAGEVLKLKELRDRKERQSTRYEEIKKDGYVDSISGFNMELTAFPLVSLAEQLIVAELDDEVQVYRELASWLGTKSGLPE